MTIVLDENKWAKEMIDGRTLGKKPTETLRRVARLYIDKGYKKKDVRMLLEKFLLECDPSTPLPRWSNALDRTIDKAYKFAAINIPYIEITNREMDIIDSIEVKQAKRLAFTMLCLSKYWDAVSPGNDHWVNNKDSYVMQLANINTSIKRQSKMIHDLESMHLIQFSRIVDNTNIRVLFASDGDVVLRISDFRNLGYQYMMYKGGPFFKCKNCGITTKYTDTIKGMNKRYCKDCAIEVSIRQRVDSVMRKRGKI